MLPRPDGGTAIGKSDHRQLTVIGRGRAEQFRPATGSQDPARPQIADPPVPVAHQPVVFEAGRLQPLALQGLDGVAPQPQDFHDPPLRPSRASTLEARRPKHAHADDHA
jgi:hypothetical protein